jgi:pimeloyl-ACP methyl ester carboxylesterase
MFADHGSRAETPPASAPTREHRLRANGLQHHVVEWGTPEGEPVVLLHGFLDLAFGYAKLAALLPGYRVLALDFRGHGETDRVPEGGYYHFPDYLLDLHQLLPQLVREPFHLVGHSMGGSVAAMFAATHSVRTLSMLDSLGIRQEDASRAPKRLATWLEQASSPRAPAALRDLDHAVERLCKRHPTVEPAFLRALAAHATRPHEAGLTWRFDPLHHTLSPVAFDPHRFEHMLQSIDAPTLVLMGQRGLRTPDHHERVAQLRRPTWHEVPNAGHMLHWTHAEEVAAHLRDHFRA